MLKKLLLISLTLTMLLVTSCTNNAQGIEDTVRGFFQAYANRQFSKCLDYLSSELRVKEGDENLLNRLKSDRFWAVRATLSGIGEPQINGANATVLVDYEVLFVQIKTIKVTLIKESGKWKISEL